MNVCWATNFINSCKVRVILPKAPNRSKIRQLTEKEQRKTQENMENRLKVEFSFGKKKSLSTQLDQGPRKGRHTSPTKAGAGAPQDMFTPPTSPLPATLQRVPASSRHVESPLVRSSPQKRPRKGDGETEESSRRDGPRSRSSSSSSSSSYVSPPRKDAAAAAAQRAATAATAVETAAAAAATSGRSLHSGPKLLFSKPPAASATFLVRPVAPRTESSGSERHPSETFLARSTQTAPTTPPPAKVVRNQSTQFRTVETSAAPPPLVSSESQTESEFRAARLDFGQTALLRTKREDELCRETSKAVAEVLTLKAENSAMRKNEKILEKIAVLECELSEADIKLEEKRKALEKLYLPSMTVKLSQLDESTLNLRDLAALREGKAQREDRVKALEDKVREAQELADSRKQKEVEAEEARRESTAKVQSLELKIAEGGAALEKEREERSAVEAERMELKARLRDLEAKVSESAESMLEERRAKEEELAKAKELEARVVKLSEEAAEKSKMLDREIEASRTLKEGKRKAEEFVQQREQELSNMDSRLIDVTRQRNDSLDEAKVVKEELAKLKGVNHDLRRQAEDFRKEKDTQEASFVDREATWSVREGELKERARLAEEESDLAQKEARAKTQINEQLHASQKMLREKLKAATQGPGAAALALDTVKLVDLKATLEMEQKAKRSLEDERAKQAREVERLKGELAASEKRLEEARRETSVAEKTTRVAERERQAKSAECAEMNEQVKQAYRSIKDYKVKMDDQLERIRKTQGEKDKLRDREEELMKQVSSLRRM